MISEKRFSEYAQTFSSSREKTESNDNSFIPQKNGKNVKISAGVDQGKYAISIISAPKKLKVTSTELIEVKEILLPNKNMAMIFSLTDEDLLSIFISFAIDLESILVKDDNITIVEIYNRYLYWQKMFKVDRQSISEEKVKGLVGELNILDKYMIPKYGVEEALKGWVGAENSHKDFAYNDGIWYEAKSINLGKTTVKISSIEQLQADTDGLLIITELEKTSVDNSNGVILLELLNTIVGKLETDASQQYLFDKINALGISLDVFSNKEHIANTYRYIIHETKNYLVDDSFPRISRDHLPIGIGLVNYEIIVSEIEKKRIEFK